MDEELDAFESEVYASIEMKRASTPGVAHVLGYVKNYDGYNSAIIFENGGRYSVGVVGAVRVFGLVNTCL